MRFDIALGSHKARVNLTMDGKGGFAGGIDSADFGQGDLAGVVTGDRLTGVAELDGHHAHFDASLSDGHIAGTLTAGWFFSQSFTGEAVP